MAANPSPSKPGITWADLTVGSIVRYQHVNRARRLANKPLVIRHGRVERVDPPPGVRDGQTIVTVLRKDGTPHAGLGRVALYGLDFIVAVQPPPAGDPA